MFGKITEDLFCVYGVCFIEVAAVAIFVVVGSNNSLSALLILRHVMLELGQSHFFFS